MCLQDIILYVSRDKCPTRMMQLLMVMYACSVAYIKGRVTCSMLQPAAHEGFYIGSASISFHVLKVASLPSISGACVLSRDCEDSSDHCITV